MKKPDVVSLAIPLIAFILFIATAVNAQSPSDSCRVSAYWWDSKAGLGSGITIFGRFQAQVGKKPTVKAFTFDDTNLVVTAGVEYIYENSSSQGAPTTIELAIAVSNKEEKNIFESAGNAKAGTRYNRHWEILSISKKMEFKERIYTFAVTCESRGK